MMLKILTCTVVGQTRLLIMGRFQQFEGRVDNCEKETACSDLDGLGDMVSFQVDENENFR